MDKSEILKNLETAIVDGNKTRVREAAREALTQKIDPLEVVELGLSKGMAYVGERFERGEAYLPELVGAADSFHAAMEILSPEMEMQKKKMIKSGTVLIGTVRGDIHDIGKNIVATILETHGFTIVDLGVDTPVLDFIEQASKVKADVIAISSLMTNSMPVQREIIEALEQRNLREKYRVIVGGGSVTREWADEIGADGYGINAAEAATLVKKMLSQKSKPG
jgi:corrinoid protein of di/trimethylamine methyltransferase